MVVSRAMFFRVFGYKAQRFRSAFPHFERDTEYLLIQFKSFVVTDGRRGVVRCPIRHWQMPVRAPGNSKLN